MPYYEDNPLAAALGAAGSFLSGSSAAKQQTLENKRQAEIDRQNAAITAAQLAEYNRLAQPVPLPAVTPTGNPPPGEQASVGTKPSGKPGKMVSPGHFGSVVDKVQRPVETIDDDIRQAQAWLAAGAQANRPDIIAAANTLLTKLQADKANEQYHQEQMANTAAWHAATLAGQNARDARRYQQPSANTVYNAAHPRPSNVVSLAPGVHGVQGSDAFQQLSPRAQRLVMGWQDSGVSPSRAQVLIADQLTGNDRVYAALYVSSPDYPVHAKPPNQGPTHMMEPLPSGVSIDYSATKIKDGIVYAKGSDDQYYAWRKATQSEIDDS